MHSNGWRLTSQAVNTLSEIPESSDSFISEFTIGGDNN